MDLLIVFQKMFVVLQAKLTIGVTLGEKHIQYSVNKVEIK